MENKTYLLEEEITKQLKRNLNKLLAVKNLTLTKFADILDVENKSTVSNYLNENRQNVPSITSLYRLKEYFGISLDALLSPNFDPNMSSKVSTPVIADFNKFLGVYSLYYYSSNGISVLRNGATPKLSYGILAIVKNTALDASITKDNYKVFACFSFSNDKQANEFKTKVLSAINSNNTNDVKNLFSNQKSYSEGRFDLIQRSKFYSISLTSYARQETDFETANPTVEYTITDQVLMLGYNPDQTTVSQYIGGGMLVTSISRGQKKCPCSQIIISSRNSMSDNEAELIQILQRKHQFHFIENAAKEIIKRNNKLLDENYSKEIYNIVLSSCIQNIVTEELINNNSEFLFLLEDEDQDFYRLLKGKNNK